MLYLLIIDKPDKRIWNLEPSGLFFCKSFLMHLLVKHSLPPVIPSHAIWKANVPPKVRVLAWIIAHSFSSVQRRRPYSSFSPHWCVMSRSASEMMFHLRQCPVPSALWARLLSEATYLGITLYLARCYFVRHIVYLREISEVWCWGDVLCWQSFGLCGWRGI